MEKQIKWKEDSRDQIKEGVDILANAVKATLGIRGRNVGIERLYLPPYITKDGVTVAREIELQDPVQNMGVQMVKEVALKTNKLVGDGTTTAIVLAQAIYTAGLKSISEGGNPMGIKKGIDKAVLKVVAFLKTLAVEVSSDDLEKIKQVASISANNDESIGDVVAQAVHDIKKDGIVTIEEAKGTETYVRIVDGMQISKGFISPFFCTDAERMEVVFENPYILLCDSKISLMKDLMPILSQIMQNPRPLVLIAEDIEGEALASLVVNKMQGKLKVVAIKSPEFGEIKGDVMQDIAVITGGTVISEMRGSRVEDATLQLLGQAEKVIVTRENTTIVNGKGNKEDIESRIAQIKNQIEAAKDDRNKMILQQRCAKLSGGIAVIYVGAMSEIELRERKDRFDDSLNATLAAVKEGIVPGGGVALIRAIASLDEPGDTSAETMGIAVIRKALEEPLRQIVENAGIESATVVSKVKKGEGDFGFNARTELYENLLLSGVIDPVMVTRVALENAASIAGIMLTMECTVFIPEKQKYYAPPQG
jgi:chaperonin GroEL